MQWRCLAPLPATPANRDKSVSSLQPSNHRRHCSKAAAVRNAEPWPAVNSSA
jgi:hypothetical protein